MPRPRVWRLVRRTSAAALRIDDVVVVVVVVVETTAEDAVDVVAVETIVLCRE